MIRILQSVNIMDRAGLETMLMNYYRNIDRTKVQFDFLTHREEKGAYDEEICDLGGRIYHAPRLYPQNYPRYFKYMKQFFDEHHEYKIIHSHIDAMSYFPLKAAEKNNIPVRIGHSHNSKLDLDMKYPIKYYALKRMSKVANRYFACGKLAGEFMYPNLEFTIIRNAIDLDKFGFCEETREAKRKELNIGDELVIGHIGRYSNVKNQDFLIDVFKCINDKNPKTKLMLVGKGENEKQYRDKVEKLGIEKEVRFLIDRSDVDELYQVMDVFVLPSIFEGLPVVGVEAQANGLPCIVSEGISRELLMTNNIMSLDLKSGVEKWADVILSINVNRNIAAKSELQKAGYDIKIEADKLQSYYEETFKKCRG